MKRKPPGSLAFFQPRPEVSGWLLICAALALCAALLAASPPVFAAEITLAWNPPQTNADGTPVTDLGGFKMYYGTSPGNYTDSVNVGNATSYRLSGLAAGGIYYLAVTAYDISGNESGFSNEVSATAAAGAVPGIFRDGTWFIDLNGNGTWDGQPTDMRINRFGGQPGDIPVTGDWDGTGTDRAGIFRDGYWYLDLNGNGLWDGQPTDAKFKFGGAPGQVPVTGDWDGTGATRAGIYQDGFWYLDMNGNGAWDGQPTDEKCRFGRAGDQAVAGLW